MQHVLKKHNEIDYIGGDIVNALILENNKKYASKHTSFITLDITQDVLPDADLIIVRDCLFHLSYADISFFLKNLSKSKIKYILTTGHIEVKNTDIVTGDFRKINLFTAPFNWDKESLYNIKEEGKVLYLFECA